MVRRHAILGLAALLFGVGCHAGPAGGLKRQEPPIAKETISKARIIALHNKNAATIRSFKASPSILVSADGQQGKLSGQMAMEREKDFRLKISSTMQKRADIGSNAKGFWFWVKDNPDKAIYHCDYEQVKTSPLTVTMQPEWIVEAMGLREISEREAATISASTERDKPGQLILTQLRKDARGETLTKVTVVDESSGEILEHRLYSGAQKDLLARASISETQHIAMIPTEDDPSGSIVNFPARIQLEWVVEKFTLDITMGKPQINPKFPEDQRTALFTEPQISGAVRTDLARAGGPPSSASSNIRESMPAPKSGVRLGKPEIDPIGVEGALSSPRDVAPATAELSYNTSPRTAYIGPQVPTGTDPDAVRASARSSGWSRANFDR